MTAILLGLFWGFIEATLGGILHLIKFPFTGQILGPIGFGILYLAMRKGLKPSQLFIIPVIAAAMKFSDAFLFGIPFVHVTITRPAAAILMQGLSFVLISTWLKRGNWKINAVSALALSSASVVSFNLLFDMPFTESVLWSVIVMTLLTFAIFEALYATHPEKVLMQMNMKHSSLVVFVLFVASLSLRYLTKY